MLTSADEVYIFLFFFSSRRRHTRYIGDWSSDVCSSDLSSHGADPVPWEDLRRGDQDGRGDEGPRPCGRSNQTDVETLGLRLLAGGGPPDPLQFVRVEAGRLDALRGPGRQDDGGRHGRPPQAAPRDRAQEGPRGEQPGHRDVPRSGRPDLLLLDPKPARSPR